MQCERGELAKADASLTRALAIKEKAYGPAHPEFAITLTNLGMVQRARNRIDDAGGS